MNQCENPLGADNQQERPILSPDFLAGLITGEGSYFIGIRRYRGYITLYPGFSMRMNDIDTISAVEQSLNSYGLSVYRNKAVYHRCVNLSTIGIAPMRKHLDFFIPLLSGNKKRAAEVVSEFTNLRESNRNRRYTLEEVECVEKLREINGPSRGRLPIGILRDYTLRPHARQGVDKIGGKI